MPTRRSPLHTSTRRRISSRARAMRCSLVSTPTFRSHVLTASPGHTCAEAGELVRRYQVKNAAAKTPQSGLCPGPRTGGPRCGPPRALRALHPQLRRTAPGLPGARFGGLVTPSSPRSTRGRPAEFPWRVRPQARRGYTADKEPRGSRLHRRLASAARGRQSLSQHRQGTPAYGQAPKQPAQRLSRDLEQPNGGALSENRDQLSNFLAIRFWGRCPRCLALGCLRHALSCRSPRHRKPGSL